MTTSNTNKTLSTIVAHRIEDLFDDFCIYVAKRYGANYDDIIIVSDFVTGSGNAQDKNEFLALCHFIFKRGSRHGFKYLAVETPEVTFTKEVSVPSTLIPCMKFA